MPAGDWHEWQPLGGPVSARLAVVESHDERIEVFAMNDDVLEHNYQVDASGAWRDWQGFGGGGYFVQALRNRDGRLEIVANNAGGVHHRWQHQPGSTWLDWQPL
ncbi:hypothetical protein SALBM135S_02969 [Streptomyces alboniger]